jgi:hypothetical protein
MDSLTPFEKSDKSIEIQQRHVIKLFINEGMKPLDTLIRLHTHYGLGAFSRSHCRSGLARRDSAEQTSQKFHDSAGPRMKVWRSSSPDDMNKIFIGPGESWRSPYGSHPRRYAILYPTSWD